MTLLRCRETASSQLTDKARAFNAVVKSTALALLDTGGEHDPNRCIDKKLRYASHVNNDSYTLVPGRDICVAVTGDRVAILTIDVGADPARRSLTFHYTLWQRPGPAAAPGPRASRPTDSIWTRVTTGRLTLSDYRTVDLDTGAFGDFDSTAAGTANAPGMDLALSERATLFRGVVDPIAVALLSSPGEPDPDRCLDPELLYGYGIVNRNYQLLPGREVCVKLDAHRVAILTIDVGADTARPSLTFRYTLWRR